MTPILAHAGHWLVSLLYVVPVVALVGGLLVNRRRDKQDVAGSRG